jgi:hypothetical protein
VSVLADYIRHLLACVPPGNTRMRVYGCMCVCVCVCVCVWEYLYICVFVPLVHQDTEL